MIEFWKSLAYMTKFSTIAFIITGVLGLFSMGLLGTGLYYLVSFLFRSYPSINDWRGDWVWPVLIGSGMVWSFGFLFGGIAWHYLYKHIHSGKLLTLIYIIILWLWAALIWYVLIKANVNPK